MHSSYRWRGFPSLLLFVLTVLPLEASTAPAEKLLIRIPRVTRAPKLDDFLSGKPRQSEVTLTDFRQREPYDGQPASERTAVHLSYDDTHLYVVFECEADPQSLRARLSKRDDVFADETVNVTLDTYHDRRRAYMFHANPLGVQLDGVTTEGQDDDYHFDTVWQSAGRITESGYTVWMAIPFRSLRFALEASPRWGILLSRYNPVRREFSSIPYVNRKMEGFVEQFAVLDGLESVSPGRNVQMIPYGFTSAQRFLDFPDIGSPFLRSQRESRAGLDAKIVLKDQITVDVTANPDFSQVESDEPQVTANQRFEVFFPERRPFFLENAGFFETPEQIFFSRRIENPRFGARLTGKAGKWAFGALGVDDRSPYEGQATAGVIRVQREIGRQSTVGGLVTTRQTAFSSSALYSVDTRLRLGNQWVISAQAMHSRTKGSGNGGWGGNASFVQARYVSRKLTSSTMYRDRDAGFRAELGFIPRVDVRQLRNATTYRWRPQSGPVLSFGPGVYGSVVRNHAGRLQDWSLEIPFRLDLKGPSAIEVSRTEAYEFYQGSGFRRNDNYVYGSTDVLRWVGVSGSFSRGRGINYYPAGGLQPFAVDEMAGTFGLTLRPTRRARIDETYLYTRLGNAGRPILNDHVWRSKVNYQFSRALSLRTIVDFRGSLANDAWIDRDRLKRLTTDVLLTYQLNYGAALHAGFTNRRENLDSTYRRRMGNPTMTTGQQIFVKLSYLLRF